MNDDEVVRMKISLKFKKNVEDIFALTPMQEGMLFHYLHDPQSRREFEQLYLEISGIPDRERFRQAWNIVIDDNQMLRTQFHWEKLKQPVQVVLKEHPLSFSYYDLSGIAKGNKDIRLQEIILDDRSRMFLLDKVPFRVAICKMEKDRFGMLISNHHILYDGWSNGIILKEFFDTYEALSIGSRPHPLPALKERGKAGFKSFVRLLQNHDTSAQNAFWKHYLAGFEGKQGHAKKRKRDTDDMEKFLLKLSAEFTEQMEALARQYNISVSSILYAAWGLLLQKYNNHFDILFDTTVSGRSAKLKGIENTVGLFINTLPVRIRSFAGETVIRMLYDTYDRVRQWQDYENSSQMIIKEHLDQSPQQLLFDSLVVIENYPLEVEEIVENSEFSIISRSYFGQTVYDLTLLITISNDIEVEFGYRKDLFPDELITLLSRNFVSVIQAIIKNPKASLSSIDVVSAHERNKLLEHLRPEPVESAISTHATDDEESLDGLELKLQKVWADVLKVNRRELGRNKSFFDFDNHSLKASMLVARIHKVFTVKVPLAEIFAHPTLAGQAGIIKEKKVQDDPYITIGPVETKEYYPASSSQRRFYFIQQMSPDSTAYNTTTIIQVEGQPDITRLEQAFTRLIKRHESLRTSFQQEEVNGTLVQRIHEDVGFVLEHLMWSETDIQTMAAGFSRPFDLTRPPLLRAALAKLEEEKYLLLFDIHHIVADGSSSDVLIEDFAAFYSGKLLPPLIVQYKDFTHCQDMMLSSGALDKQKAYWLKNLSGDLPVLNLATDFPRPAVQSLEGDRLEFVLPPELIARIESLLKETGTTLYMVFLASINVLLSKYTGQEDILIGTPISGRHHAEAEHITGLMLESIVLRNYPIGEKNFAAFLDEVKHTTLGAYDNQLYPFREIMKLLAPEQDLSRTPMFDVMLNVYSKDNSLFALEGLECQTYPFTQKVSKVDITVEVVESRQGITMELEYCSTLYKAETMMKFGRFLLNILETATKQPTIPLAEIEILSEKEKDRLNIIDTSQSRLIEADFDF
jgi:non-ribosomal peptide synthetase component F/acyl carrier protein